MPSLWSSRDSTYLESLTCASEELTNLAKHLSVNSQPDPIALYVGLDEACIGQHHDLVEYFLTIYPPSQWTNASTQRTSQHGGHGKYVMRTFKYPIELTSSIVDANDGQILRCFLEHGLDLSSGVFRKVFWVYDSVESVHVLDVLLEHGADPYRRPPGDSWMPALYSLSEAAVLNETAAVSVFIKHGVEFNDAIYWAAHWGSVDAATPLLEAGQDVNHYFEFVPNDLWTYIPPRDLIGRRPRDLQNVGTALHAAATMVHHSGDAEQFTGGDDDMIELLLKYGASRGARDRYGRTAHDLALYTSCEASSPYILKLLQEGEAPSSDLPSTAE